MRTTRFSRGELSGHYYFKENFTAECQGLALIKLANLVCKKGKPVSELVAPLRKYFSSGEINSTVADVKPVLDAIRKKYADGNMYELDGISSEYPNWWFNVRSSNTEPAAPPHRRGGQRSVDGREAG